MWLRYWLKWQIPMLQPLVNGLPFKLHFITNILMFSRFCLPRRIDLTSSSPLSSLSVNFFDFTNFSIGHALVVTVLYYMAYLRSWSNYNVTWITRGETRMKMIGTLKYILFGVTRWDFGPLFYRLFLFFKTHLIFLWCLIGIWILECHTH